MSFADINTNDKPFNSDIRRTEFIDLSAGAHRIRILEAKAKKFKTHYINRATVVCLEDECPICTNNKRLIMQFPDTFRDQSGYNRGTERYYVNVLDKTPAKVCSCGKEYKRLETTICSCGQVLPEKQPLNKVKVLAKGKALFEHLETIHTSILDGQGESVGISNYDLNIIVSGAGRDISYTPIPDVNSNEPANVEVEKYFDLDKAVIKLTPEEMLDLQRGVSLKDIFAARRTKEAVVVETQVAPEILESVNAEVAKLFQV